MVDTGDLLMSVSLLKYYKNKGKIPMQVVSEIKRRKGILYGERALNQYFPSYLDRPTEDYDVFVRHPRKVAVGLERRLDRTFGGDYFQVESAQH